MDYKDRELGIQPDFFWFRAKRRLIGRLVRRETGGRRARILNLGAGVGEDLSVIAAHGDVTVVDIDPRAIALIPPELVREKRVMDARSLEYPDGSFDLALAFDMLEHIEDDRAALREIHRVLRPGGALIFTVPAFPLLTSAHDRVLGHKRRYTKRLLRERLRDFQIESLGYWSCALFFPLALQRLFDKGTGAKKPTYFHFPALVNSLCYGIMAGELLLMDIGLPLPIGSSIFGIARKC